MATIETSPPPAPEASAPHGEVDPAREVLNQAPPLQPVNLFEVDVALQEALESRGRRVGRRARARDRGGVPAARRPASTRAGPSATSRSCAPTTGSATGSTRSSSIPPGTGCSAARSSGRSTACRGATEKPGGHTRPRGAVHALRQRQRRRDVPGVDDDTPRSRRCATRRLSSRRSGSRGSPSPTTTRGALAGMAMTERQGGSDVRANITRARPDRRRSVRDLTATSGSARIRRATSSSCSRRRPAGSRAS